MSDELFDPHDLELRRMLRDLSAGPPAPAVARARLRAALKLGGPPGPSGETPKSGHAPKNAPNIAAPAANAPLGKVATSANLGWILGGAGVAAVVGAWLATSARPSALSGKITLPQAALAISAPVVTPSANAPVVSALGESRETKGAEGDPAASRRAPMPISALSLSASAEPHAASAKNAKAEEHSDLSLAAERRMLDAARAALVAGEPKAGLDRVARHAKQFPRGVLTEEREALYVDALVASGRYDDARRRAEGFRARYPGSLFAPSVNAALQAIP